MNNEILNEMFRLDEQTAERLENLTAVYHGLQARNLPATGVIQSTDLYVIAMALNSANDSLFSIADNLCKLNKRLEAWELIAEQNGLYIR